VRQVLNVRAAVATAIPSDALELVDAPEPIPGPAELLVELEACGICGTDLHILEGRSYRPELPFTLGHEPVGRVVAAGSEADSTWLGRRVSATLFTGCGTCPWCTAGDERICPALTAILGVWRRPGGFAERFVVPTRHAVVVPEPLAPADAATLIDAGATASNAMRAAGGPPDGLMVVCGGGPVGFITAELAKRQGWDVLVVQPSEARRRLIDSMGHRVVATLADVDEAPAIVIDAAGTPAVAPWALSRLRPRGTLVLAAYAVMESFDMAPAARKELRIVGVRSGTRADLEAVLAAAAAGEIRLPPVSAWSLGEINAAFAALREKQVPGKAVVVPMRA
jgi:propanol-preferring alcohol dehydrogenase